MNACRSHRRPGFSSFTPTAALTLDLAEREFQRVIEKIGGRIAHHDDRPEIELQILAFLTHALGPSAAGIAKEMGIGVGAAAVHLRALSEANRIWGQPVHGPEMGWHISRQGRQFLEAHRLLAA